MNNGSHTKNISIEQGFLCKMQEYLSKNTGKLFFHNLAKSNFGLKTIVF